MSVLQFAGRAESSRYDAQEPQREADASAHLIRLAMEHAERVNAVIRAIPAHVMCPALLAEIANALADKAGALHDKPRDDARGYLCDLAEDMRLYQLQEDAR